MVNYIDENGVERRLGNIIPSRGVSDSWPIFGSVPTTRVIPRAEWKPLVDAMGVGPDVATISPVHDQDGQGMCNASATCSAMETQRLKQGLSLVLLSGGDLYWRINGGGDNGSMLEDGLRVSMASGVASVDVAPYLTRSPNNPGAGESRRRYRVLEAYSCPRFDHVFSAALLGFDIISGILWYGNYKPDRDGWLPARGSGGVGGHAVHGYKPTYRGDTYGIWHKNSWGDEWGLNGRCVFPESAYGQAIGGWWAVRSVVDEGGEAPAPVEG